MNAHKHEEDNSSSLRASHTSPCLTNTLSRKTSRAASARSDAPLSSLAALPASSEDEDSWRDFFDTHVYAREVQDTGCDGSSEHMSTPAGDDAASIAVTVTAAEEKPYLDDSTAAEHCSSTIDSEDDDVEEGELEAIMRNLWGECVNGTQS